jgi:predicted ATP-grasp superfamily ATP-dependent carboligase
MTTVFVSEYVCGGGGRPAGESPWASPLFAEGRAMLAAVLDDFARIPGVDAATIVDDELAPHFRSLGRVVSVRPGDEEHAFRTLARSAHWTLVIAPEFHRTLETRCRWVVEEGGRLLGPTPEAVALTADKLALARHLDRAGVPTPETTPAAQSVVGLPRPPWVLKPRFGAGSQETRLVTDQALPVDSWTPGATGEKVIQPYITGQPASVGFLLGPRQALTLEPAAQRLSDDGTFQYLGGRLPLPELLARRARRIAQVAVTAVPGLRGYVGVDVVLGDEGDGSRDVVIEINPRLTTSYIGYRALADRNLAELMLSVVRGDVVAEPTWRFGPGRGTALHWTPDGQIELVSVL